MPGRLLQWLIYDSERRSAPREAGTGLTAFYWDGEAPQGHAVRDVSYHGAYIETSSKPWPSGTQMYLTLQVDLSVEPAATSPEAVCVRAELVRTSADGMGLKFLFGTANERRSVHQFLKRWKSAAGASITKPKVRSASGLAEGG